MKNLIRKILKEETSGLSDAQKDASYILMNNRTKGYQWYHDTPEQPFEWSEGSIWLVNSDTEDWMLELKKSGKLRYNYEIFKVFSKYMGMEESDFESFIKIWVEDVLEREVTSTDWSTKPIQW